MSPVIVAALDTTAAARPVLECAQRLAEVAQGQVRAVHVTDRAGSPIDTPRELAARACVPLELLDPPLGPALLGALDRPGVTAAVMGARSTPGGRRPVGPTTRHVIERSSCPVLVVPPEVLSPRAFGRALVPLEGTPESSQPILDALAPLVGDRVELVVLHVFTPESLPSMLDHPGRDLAILGEEFLARHLPDASRIDMRTGPTAARVAELSDEQDVDLVALSWSQATAPDRARVVRDVLAGSRVPVLLLPSRWTGPGPGVPGSAAPL